jgi:hypothetical protein
MNYLKTYELFHKELLKRGDLIFDYNSRLFLVLIKKDTDKYNL